MTSLENLQRLEEQLRSMLAEREQLKSRVEDLKAAAPRETAKGDSKGLKRAYDLLMREREGVRNRVESLLAALSRMSKAGSA